MRSLQFLPACLFVAAAGFGAEAFLKDDSLVASVQKKVREIQPTREEKRFDEIGWAPSIVAGRALSQKLNKPLFLFTYNGNIDTGRC
jgi:hypothetical protein